MKRLTALVMEYRVRRALLAAVALCGFALLLQAVPRTSGAGPAVASRVALASALAAAPGEGWSNPANVTGAKACIQCHRSEYLAWLSTKHAKTGATIAAFTGNTAKYAEALGIKAEDVAHNSLCANCHATSQASAEGKIHAISGVSCESCHGGSGGENGWLNRHAVYGPNVTRLEQETPEHRKERIDFCRNSGMVRAANLYGIARNCLQCHSVTDEKLVNAGHKAGGGFELIGWSIGEVRHNFHMDQSTNANGPSLWQKINGGDIASRKRLEFIVGVLANMEVSLNALASATEGDTDFTNAHKERLGGATEILGGIIDALEDSAPEELASVVETLEEAAVEDADFGEPEAREKASAAAMKIAGIGKKIATSDGSKLAGVDEFMNDEVVSVKGKAYSRKP